MVKGEETLAVSVEHDDMVDADRLDDTTVELTVDRGDDNDFDAVLGIEQAVPDGASAPGSSPRCDLLSLQSVVEAPAQHPPQTLQIRVIQWIHLSPSGCRDNPTESERRFKSVVGRMFRDRTRFLANWPGTALRFPVGPRA